MPAGLFPPQATNGKPAEPSRQNTGFLLGDRAGICIGREESVVLTPCSCAEIVVGLPLINTGVQTLPQQAKHYLYLPR